MGKPVTATIEKHFGSITDPQIERTKRHKLIDILVIAICATICGCDNWEDMAAFGEAKVEWFGTFLELPNGIPSHDTFNRVFGRLNSDEFRSSFMAWISAGSKLIGGQVIALDGKVLRRSHDRGIGQAATPCRTVTFPVLRSTSLIVSEQSSVARNPVSSNIKTIA